MGAAPPKIRCRQIQYGDLSAVGDLLVRGFPRHDRAFWQDALEQLTRREPPQGLPKYGYLLEADGIPTGVVLLISSVMRDGGTMSVRCNVSSWYVEPQFRTYAPLLVAHALRHKEVTYLNVSAAPHTWPIIEAQGFIRYGDGVFISVPALKLFGDRARVFAASRQPSVAFDPADQEMLREHESYGCIGLWCETSERALPFVFRPRLAKRFIPCAQLIYCRDIADFVRFAGPLGRYFARHGRPLVVVDANGPIPGLLGIYRSNRPKYFKGPQRPRLGDLAYTEYAMLNV